MVPDGIDLLLVDGPAAVDNPYATIPPGRSCCRSFPPLRWRTLYPALGVRKLPAEKGCAELFFREEKKLAA
jgi:hypothetical protein